MKLRRQCLLKNCFVMFVMLSGAAWRAYGQQAIGETTSGLLEAPKAENSTDVSETGKGTNTAAGPADVALNLLKRGNRYFNSGDKRKAIAYYQEAVYTDPHSYPAQRNLGVAFLENNQFRDAELIILEKGDTEISLRRI